LPIFDDTFPLLVAVGPQRFDVESVREMAASYEPYFERNQRYVVLNVTPRGAAVPDANGRKLVIDWVNSPRVKDCSARLCLGTATVVEGALSRGALTAMLWFWTPPSPLKPVATINEGLDYCFDRLRSEHLQPSAGEAAVRKLVQGRLRGIV